MRSITIENSRIVRISNIVIMNTHSWTSQPFYVPDGFIPEISIYANCMYITKDRSVAEGVFFLNTAGVVTLYDTRFTTELNDDFIVNAAWTTKQQ